MPAAGSGYASGINAGVNRDKLAMEFQDQQRRHKAEDAVVAANNATVSGGPNDVAQLAVEMEEYTAQQDQRRQRVVLDKVLTKGIVSGDWDYANDALKANDLPMLQEYFRAEGIVGFHKFDPNNAEHVEMRNKFAQENYDTTYDELNQKDREEFDNQLVVYDKGAGEIELADKHELAAIGGLPERNTKVAKSFEADKSLMKRLQEQKRVAQENLRAVNPSYSPLPAGDDPALQAKKLAGDILTKMYDNGGPEVRGFLAPAIAELTGQDPEKFTEASRVPTPAEQEDLASAGAAHTLQVKRGQDAAKLYRENADADAVRQEALDLGFDSAKTFVNAIEKQDLVTVFSNGKKVGWRKVPPSEKSKVGETVKKRDFTTADESWADFNNTWAAAGVDPNDYSTWTPEYENALRIEAGVQKGFRGLQNLDVKARESFRNIEAFISLGEGLATGLNEEDVGPLDNLANEILKYTTIQDEGARQAKGLQLLSTLLAVSSSDRSSKYLLERIDNISSASGFQSAKSAFAGILKLAHAQAAENKALLNAFGTNPAYARIIERNQSRFDDVVELLQKRLKGFEPAKTGNSQDTGGTKQIPEGKNFYDES